MLTGKVGLDPGRALAAARGDVTGRNQDGQARREGEARIAAAHQLVAIVEDRVARSGARSGKAPACMPASV